MSASQPRRPGSQASRVADPYGPIRARSDAPPLGTGRRCFDRRGRSLRRDWLLHRNTHGAGHLPLHVRQGPGELDSLVWMLTTPEFVTADVRTPPADRLQLFCAHKINHIAIMDGLCLHSVQSIWDCVAEAPHASTAL